MNADGQVARVLAKQVQDQISGILAFGLTANTAQVIVDRFVAPLVTGRDVAVKLAEYWKGRAEKAWERGDDDALTVLQLRAELTAALDEVQRLAAARLVLAVFGTPDDAPQPFSLCRDTEIVGLGVQWPGGAVTIKWTPPDRLATVTSHSLEDALAVHDPDGTLGVVWLSEDLGTLAEAEERAIRAEQSRDKLRASGEQHLTDLMTIADKNLARAERAETELADLRQQLDQLRAICSEGAFLTPEEILTILDTPTRPAGHDESEQ
jgi:hypothetical protein